MGDFVAGMVIIVIWVIIFITQTIENNKEKEMYMKKIQEASVKGDKELASYYAERLKEIK